MDSVLWDGNKSWTKYAETYDPITVGSIDGTDTEPHDHGIIRAIYSEYVPNKKVKGKPSHTIFVARLNPRTTEVVDAIDCGYHVSQQIYFLSNKTNKDLTEKAIGRKMEKGSEDTIESEFAKFGKIMRCRLVRDLVTGKSKRYAFIEYDSSSAAQHAYKEMHHEWLDSAEILVDYELERRLPGWKPRRLGGGFGGKKETGQLRFGCRERPFRKPIGLEMQLSEVRDSRYQYNRQRHPERSSKYE